MHGASNQRGPEDGREPGYLYHKDRDRPVAKRPPTPRRNHPDGKRANKKGEQGSSQSVWPTVRALLIVVVVMGAFLYGAQTISRRSWQKKLQKARQPAPTPQVAMPSAEPNDAGMIQDTRLRPGEGISSPKDLSDTELIRKAAFMADQGRAFLEEGNNEQAIRLLREALDTWPQLEEVWALLGKAYLANEDYKLAQGALERAVEEQDDSPPETLNDLGVALLLQGRPQKAEKLFTRLLKSHPDYAPGYLNMGLCQISAHQGPKARGYLERYLELQPDSPKALREIAYLDAAQGQYDQALKRIEKALALDPAAPGIHVDYAAALALLGRHEDAVKQLRAAAEQEGYGSLDEQLALPAFKDFRESEPGKAYLASLAAQEAPAPPPADSAAPSPSP